VGNRLIKTLVGQRRSGKSYILRQIAKQLIDNGVKPENTLFINREFIDFDFLKSWKELDELIKLYKSELNPSGKVYIFIDEVQIIDGWEKVVNSYSQDFSESYELFISGSNSKMLSGELATLLSGRYVCFEVFPFSYSEYTGIAQKEKGRKSYLEYMNSGGLPELFMLQKHELRRNYISSLKDTVLLRDIIQRYNIRDPKLLEDIFVFLVNNASSLISVNNLVNYFKSRNRRTSYEVVSTYTGYIEDAFLIHRCDRYDIKGKEVLSGNAKFYANDLAYKNYLYPGYGYGWGYLVENLIYLELCRAGFDVYTGNIRNKEVDFVAQKADRIIYLQSTYMLTDEATVEREYSALEAIDDNYEKIVVSLDEIALPLRDGIKHIQAWELADKLY
jgi:predicted AAA+ superfamily ATPase